MYSVIVMIIMPCATGAIVHENHYITQILGHYFVQQEKINENELVAMKKAIVLMLVQ